MAASNIEKGAGDCTTRFVKPNDRSQFILKEIASKDDIHKLHIRTARVLMLVNVDFDNKLKKDGVEIRHGATHDYVRLNETMIENLGYEDFLDTFLTKKDYCKNQNFREWQDQFTNYTADSYQWTKSQMTAILKAMVADEYPGGDAFFIFIDSHGGTDKGKEVIVASDGKVYVEEIISILNEQCHPENQAIPKIICIQACRGEKDVDTQNVEISSEHYDSIKQDARRDEQSKTGERFPRPSLPYSEATKDSVPLPEVYTSVECPQNFLIIYATPKGCLADRIPKVGLDSLIDEGSIFVQIFCNHLEQCQQSQSIKRGQKGIALLPMLLGVNTDTMIRYLQCPVLVHQLCEAPVLWMP